MESKTQSLSPIKRIIWAIDNPLSTELSTQEDTVRFLKSATRRNELTIEPVYVAGQTHIHQARGIADPDINFHEVAEEALQKWVKKMRFPKLLSPRVIPMQNGPLDLPSTAGTAAAVIQYAEITDADLIVVNIPPGKYPGQHLPSGLAEKLLFRSKVPVLVIPPEMESIRNVSQVLFLTDFSEASTEVFPMVAKFAKSWNAQLTIYNKIDYEGPSIFQPHYSHATDETHIQDEVRRRQEEGVKLAKWAHEKGVETSIYIDRSTEDVPTAVIGYATKIKPSLIVLNSETGPFSSALFGSVTCHIVQSAHCPVAILHHTTTPNPTDIEKPASVH